MTTGRINQVTGLGPDHDSTRPRRMRVPGLPRSCKSSSEAQPLGSAQGGCHLTHLMRTQGSYRQPKLLQRSGAHTSVCIRSIAAHVNRSNSVRIRLLILRSGCGHPAEAERLLEQHQTTTGGSCWIPLSFGALHSRTRRR